SLQGFGQIIVNVDQTQTFDSSLPNQLGDFPYNDEVHLNFTQPVINVKFLALADDDVGIVAEVRVFHDGGTETDVFINGDGNFDTRIVVDLSTFKGVSQIIITDVTDTLGLVYDDFQFDTANMIKGKVTDADGNPVHGVKIAATGTSDVEFTDHDSADLLDATVDGDFQIFDVSSTASTTITATASSLDGTMFMKQFTVQPSQFSNGTADVGTLQLDNFP